jgi:tRNA-uridine 2-sulfurtransferase
MVKRVVLAMSGGVDSSVAAHLLLQDGYEVIGVFMRHGEASAATCRIEGSTASLPVVSSRTDHKQGCCTASDADDARRVASRLNIPFYALDLQADFGRIVDYFVDEYSHGRTPNPCVQCNTWIKFGRLFDFADGLDAHYVATGHYAQIERASSADGSDDTRLIRGVDASKDQSYVLFGVQRHRLQRMLLPIGGYQKTKIRELAGVVGLSVAQKKDSQEICFVTSGQHAQFVRAKRDADLPTGGTIETIEGRVVGTHEGIEGFTVGQRKGIGIALGYPAFVIRIEPDSRRVIIGPKEALAVSGLQAKQLNWLVDPPVQPCDGWVQSRYNGQPHAATFWCEADRLHVRFHQPQFGIAPGQAAVCYDHHRVLGGGWIDSTHAPVIEGAAVIEDSLSSVANPIQ